MPRDECVGDAFCIEGVCQAATETLLRVTDEAARSCEALLEEDGALVANVVFEASVDGVFVRESPRTGTSFSVREDRSIPAVRVLLVGDGDVVVAKSECFDVDGNTLGKGLVVAQR